MFDVCLVGRRTGDERHQFGASGNDVKVCVHLHSGTQHSRAEIVRLDVRVDVPVQTGDIKSRALERVRVAGHEVLRRALTGECSVFVLKNRLVNRAVVEVRRGNRTQTAFDIVVHRLVADLLSFPVL